MNKEKARKHLENAYKHLRICRADYVMILRNESGWNRDVMIRDLMNDINDTKERISRLQRYAY